MQASAGIARPLASEALTAESVTSSGNSKVEAWRNELVKDGVAEATTAEPSKITDGDGNMAIDERGKHTIREHQSRKRGHQSEEEDEEDEDDGENEGEDVLEDHARDEHMDGDAEAREGSDLNHAGSSRTASGIASSGATSRPVKSLKKRRLLETQQKENGRETMDVDDAPREPSGTRGKKRGAELVSQQEDSNKSRSRKLARAENETEEMDQDEISDSEEEEGDISMRDVSQLAPSVSMRDARTESDSFTSSLTRARQLGEYGKAATPAQRVASHAKLTHQRSRSRLPGDGPARNQHRVADLDWMKPGDSAEDLEGVKWSMDSRGLLKRLERVRTVRRKYDMVSSLYQTLVSAF